MQLAVIGEGDLDLEEEAIELRLWKGVGPLHLDGVLGRQHEKGQGQRVGGLADRHGALLHRLEERRLGLGRGAVYLVGQHQVGKDRSALELEATPAEIGVDQDVRPGDIRGHEIGRELDA